MADSLVPFQVPKTLRLLDAAAVVAAGISCGLSAGKKSFTLFSTNSGNGTQQLQYSYDGKNWTTLYTFTVAGTDASKTIEVDSNAPFWRGNLSSYTAGNFSLIANQ